jgi:hypothetical protein
MESLEEVDCADAKQSIDVFIEGLKKADMQRIWFHRNVSSNKLEISDIETTIIQVP